MMKRFLNRLRRLLGEKEEQSESKAIQVPQVSGARRTSARRERNESGEEGKDVAETAVIDPIFLRQQLSNHLTDVELQDIANSLGINYDELEGGRGRRVLEFVTHCEKKQQLDSLLAACVQHKPDVTWQL